MAPRIACDKLTSLRELDHEKMRCYKQANCDSTRNTRAWLIKCRN